MGGARRQECCGQGGLEAGPCVHVHAQSAQEERLPLLVQEPAAWCVLAINAPEPLWDLAPSLRAEITSIF